MDKIRCSKLLGRVAFVIVIVMILMLMSATMFEKMYGTDFAYRYFYSSPLSLALWALLAVSGMVCLIKSGVAGNLSTFMLHVSLVVILGGALLTHGFGRQGRLHLRQGEAPSSEYALNDGTVERLPFALSLTLFELKYYPGSNAPMDYVSNVSVDKSSVTGTVSMNNVFTYKQCRFYQSGYDSDGAGTVLSVYYDPYGIAVTYIGYAMLLLSMITFFFQKRSGFRALLKNPMLRKGVMTAVLLVPAFTGVAADNNKPATLPRDVAAEFCDIYVYYNDRICPMQTLAYDFTVKLCGKPTYRGMTAEQVLTGWFFYYDEWKTEPMIKIKGEETKRVLGVTADYVSLADFADIGGLKIDNAISSGSVTDNCQNLDAANEKFNIVSMVCTGAMLRIYPHADGKRVEWYSLADKLPGDMPMDEWKFVKNSMDYLAWQVAQRDYSGAKDFLKKIKEYQRKTAGDVVPSDKLFRAEKLYNTTNVNKPLAMACATIGILSFITFCVCLARKRRARKIDLALFAVMCLVACYLTFRIALRGYVSGHIPLSNGFETMQFLALSAAILSLIFRRKFAMAMPFGFLLSGLAMMVSTFGESNPQITQLMPVLQSPLLSVHVVVIMVAYALLGFVMLNGITAVVVNAVKSDDRESQMEYLQVLSRVMLYPAIFLLTIGIFIGAVWANVSWGRYWGWDPKEVWALITMLIYSLALHQSLLPWFRKPLFFHIFCIVAFLSVIVTYFGVNYFMGGMHSYA